MKQSSKNVTQIITILSKETKKLTLPLVDTVINEYGKKPFLILISCLLSLRAKDVVTINVCHTLFESAQTPQELLGIELKKLEEIIFKTGFYKTKAKTLHHVAKIIHEKYDDQVPDNPEDLLAIKGVGLKTANLVLGLAFGIPAICVDTHVHRISNRLGLIKTKTAEQTEIALQEILPKKHWILWNKLLVMWGQNKCAPRTPKCSQCAIKHLCAYASQRRSKL